MKMKLTAVLVFTATSFLSFLLDGPTFWIPIAALVVFGVYGILNSRRAGLDPLNDLPNALRVFLAAAGGAILVRTSTFVLPSFGLLLLAAAILLNDEYQRRAVDSVRRGRRGGSIALLGIDGSGKSSHAAATEEWLSRRGYETILMPFHRYLFVERLGEMRRAASRGRGARRLGGNPFRPLLSLLDNLILEVITSFGRGVEGRVVLYDRFIWSTYVKYYALGYPVAPLAGFYLLPRPRVAIFLDVPAEKSLAVIAGRESHIRYAGRVLETERALYLRIARGRGYPIIDSTSEPEGVQRRIEEYLSRYFPPVSGGGR